MPTLTDIRTQYPQYQDMSDSALGDALYGKFYSDMPRDQFNAKLGIGTAVAPTSAQTNAAPPIGSEISSDLGSAVNSAISSVKDYLNPFSDARHASYAKQASQPLGQALLTNLGQIGATGAAAATPLTAPAAAVNAVATPLIAHPFQALNQAVGVDLPYAQAKDQAQTALMGMRPATASPIGATTIPAPAPSMSALKTAATAGYDAAKNSGVEFKPSAIQNFSAKIQSDLNSDGLNEVLAPKTFGVLDKLGNPPANASVTTNDFRTMQRALGFAAKSPDPTERLAATRALGALTDHIENIPPGELARGTPADAAQVSQTIQEANSNYRAYKQAQEFDVRGQKAQNNADAANSGMNLENNLRTQVRQILNNPKLQRGYDPDTLAAFKAFNSGSRSANVLRMVGNAFGGGGGLGAIVAGGIGHLLLPGGGEAAPAVGFAVKALGNMQSAKQFDKLGQMIRANSPLAKSLPPVRAPSPNPLIGSIGAGQLNIPQMLGLIPARANQQQ